MTIISKQQSIAEKLKALIAKFGKKGSQDKPMRAPEMTEETVEKATEEREARSPKAGISDYIAGELSDFKEDLSPFLPVELIAGEVPYVVGMEVEAVWNAASQACATEKVNFTYSVDLANNKITYLATPSDSLASAPDSWCPIVTALPGNPDFIDKQTVYIYEQDASAAALRWSEETGRVQLFIGASRTILPKIQSMDTNFVTIGQDNPYVIEWKNRQLKTEKLARGLIRTLVLSGVALSCLLLSILLFSNISLFFTQNSLDKVTRDTKMASNTLIEDSYKAMQSDIITHNIRVQQLLDELYKIDGTLLKYTISKGKVSWEAFVPPAFSTTKNPKLSAKIVEDKPSKDGRIRIRGTK